MTDKKKSYDYTSKSRQQKRREALNKVAQANGFGSWTKLETAAINGQVIISKKGQEDD